MLDSEFFLKELYEILFDVETKIFQFNFDELFLSLNEKLRNNIESFLPEKKTSIRKNFEALDNEPKDAASK